MGIYRTAQICLNGHLITDSIQEFPEKRENFCSKCGAKTIIECPECKNSIRGFRYTEGGFCLSYKYEVPLYCYNCGKPYPWVEEKLNTTKELLKLDLVLSDDDKNELSSNMESLLSETPRTQLAATKFKNLLAKAGSATASAAKDILVDIASETAKKIIWP